MSAEHIAIGISIVSAVASAATFILNYFKHKESNSKELTKEVQNLAINLAILETKNKHEIELLEKLENKIEEVMKCL